MGKRNFARVGRRAVLAGIGATGLAACTDGLGGAAGPDSFVRRDGTRFTRSGEPYRYVGANAWYLAWLGAEADYGDRARLGRELDRLKAIGVTNLRIMASGEEGPGRNSIQPGFVNAAGEHNAALLEGRGYAMGEIGRRGRLARTRSSAETELASPAGASLTATSGPMPGTSPGWGPRPTMATGRGWVASSTG
jgi:hypothetical protein